MERASPPFLASRERLARENIDRSAMSIVRSLASEAEADVVGDNCWTAEGQLLDLDSHLLSSILASLPRREHVTSARATCKRLASVTSTGFANLWKQHHPHEQHFLRFNRWLHKVEAVRLETECVTPMPAPMPVAPMPAPMPAPELKSTGKKRTSQAEVLRTVAASKLAKMKAHFDQIDKVTLEMEVMVPSGHDAEHTQRMKDSLTTNSQHPD